MISEIEFRAWIKNRKKMVKVEEISFIGQKQIAYDEIEYRYTDKEPFHYTQLVDFDDIKLMQYTGLKDKNGVKIFEGDIFAWGSTLYQVIYADFGFKVKYVKGHNDMYLYDFQLNYFEENDEIEVIGNIYEDEDLLDVKDEI